MTRRTIRRRLRLAWLLFSAATADWIVTHPRVHDTLTYLTDVLRGRGRGHGLHVLPAGETPEDLPGPAHTRLGSPAAVVGQGDQFRAGELYPPDTLYRMYEPLLATTSDPVRAIRDQWIAHAWEGCDDAPNLAQGNWTPRDTAVDASLLAAIRLHVDGEYTGQIVDRYFSQVSVARIFDDTCGPLLRSLQAGAA